MPLNRVAVSVFQIFMKLDVDNDGFLTMNQLVPIVFSMANREQIQLITKFCEAQVSKSLDEDGIYKIPMVDMDQLFGRMQSVADTCTHSSCAFCLLRLTNRGVRRGQHRLRGGFPD